MESTSETIAARLKAAGVRCTRQRLEIGRHLFGCGNRHITAEALWHEVRDAGTQISLATIYNTLNELQSAGMVTATRVDSDRTIFDTNVEPHHHAVDLRTGDIYDLPLDAVQLRKDVLPQSARIEGLQLVVHFRTDD